MTNIEQSNDSTRFTLAELRARVKKSQAYWKSPAGKKRQAELDRENRSRKRISAKFPARSKTTRREHPTVANARRRLDLLK